MSTPQLFPGDATFAKTFKKIIRSDCGDQIEVGFKAPKGREFIALLLGDVEAGQSWVDIDRMLNELGYFSRAENDAPPADGPLAERVASLEKTIQELVCAFRAINRGRHHLVRQGDDEAPCYWQTGEWIEYLLSLCDKAEAVSKTPATSQSDMDAMPEDAC